MKEICGPSSSSLMVEETTERRTYLGHRFGRRHCFEIHHIRSKRQESGKRQVVAKGRISVCTLPTSPGSEIVPLDVEVLLSRCSRATVEGRILGPLQMADCKT